MSRAGTTFLYHNLQKHPQVFIPPRKECGYFSYHYDRGLDWYLNFFKGIKPDQVSFDISGMYFLDSRVTERILKFNPGAKIILGVRDTIDWIFSLYEQYTQNFKVPPFREFLKGCSIVREGKTININLTRNYVSSTIQQMMDSFGENMLLYDFDLLPRDSLVLLQAIECFSNIPKYFEPGNYNDSKINARDRQRVDFFYKFMHKKGVVESILKFFPRKMILSLRGKIENLSASKIRRNKSSLNLRNRYSEQDLIMVNQYFNEDSKFIKGLFQSSPLILGNQKKFRVT